LARALGGVAAGLATLLIIVLAAASTFQAPSLPLQLSLLLALGLLTPLACLSAVVRRHATDGWAATLGVQIPAALGAVRLGISDCFLPAMLLSGVLSSCRPAKRLLPRTSLDPWMLALLGVFAVGTVVGVWNLGYLPTWTWLNKDLGLLALIATYYLLVQSLSSPRRWHTLVQALIVAGSVLNVIGVAALVGRWLGVQSPFVSNWRVQGLLLNANAHGVFLLVIFLFQLSRFLHDASPVTSTRRLVSILNLTLLGTGIYLTGSRTAWVACLIGAVVVIVSARPYLPVRSVGRLLVAISPVLLLALVIGAAVSYLGPRNRILDLEDRLTINDVAIRFFLESPINWLFGIGIGSFVARAADYLPWWYGPVQIHNSYLWFLVEMGPLGLAVFLGLLYSALRNCLRALRGSSAERPAIVGVLAGLSALAVWSLAADGFYQRLLWLLFALTESALVLQAREERRT
jgi:O-antigen ligase